MVRNILTAIVFAAYDALSFNEQNSVTISPAYAPLEPDTRELIVALSRQTDNVYLLLDDESAFDPKSIDVSIENIHIVERQSLDLIRALINSKLVILRGAKHLAWYRLLAHNGDRRFIYIDHGIITKAYGAHAESRSTNIDMSQLIRRWYERRKRYASMDCQPVASEVEKFFRSSAECRHPDYFEEIGYPRFDRIAELVEQPNRATLPDTFKKAISTDDTVVLYAPTHKDDAYQTQFFPTNSFNPEEFRNRLQEEEIRLLIRMHPNEEDADLYNQLIDGETIMYAGQDICQSPTEMFPFVDILTTDYSSIYIDFLPFDRPIVFLSQRRSRFDDIRGMAFNYNRYCPGQKVEKIDEFVEVLTNITEDLDDGYSSDRAFVRRVLLPNWQESSIKKIVDRFEIK